MERIAGTSKLTEQESLPSMAVFAHAYPSGAAAMAEFKRFDKWSRRRRSEVSFWRARTGDGEWCVVVAEDGDAEAFRTFPWRGRLVALPPLHVFAFVERRLQWLRARGKGPAQDTFHYGEAIAPRLNAEGVWEIPRPGRG